MAQGAQRLGKGNPKAQSRSKQMKAKQPKKGARMIKPKKHAAVQAQTTHKKLKKVMTSSIEKEMARRAGAVLPFKMVKAPAENDAKGKKK